MKRMIIECKNCKLKVIIEGENPEETFHYLTDGTRYCKKCKKELILIKEIVKII